MSVTRFVPFVDLVQYDGTNVAEIISAIGIPITSNTSFSYSVNDGILNVAFNDADDPIALSVGDYVQINTPNKWLQSTVTNSLIPLTNFES